MKAMQERRSDLNYRARSMFPKKQRDLRFLPQVFYILLILQMVPLRVYGSTELSIHQLYASPGFYRSFSVNLGGYVLGYEQGVLRQEPGARRAICADVVTLADPTGIIDIVIEPCRRYPWKQGMYIRVEAGGVIDNNGPLYIRNYLGDISQMEPPCLPSGTIQNEEFRSFNNLRCRQ